MNSLSALPFWAATIPFAALAPQWPVIVNLLAGSLLGARLGAAAGSILGTFIGGRLLGIIPNAVLLPVLALILLASAVKVWRHG